MEPVKKKRGGARPGSGPKPGEIKKRMYIPLSRVKEVEKLLKSKPKKI